jgi:hypothetical protein
MMRSGAGKATLARMVAVFLVALAAILVAGCSEQSDALGDDRVRLERLTRLLVRTWSAPQPESEPRSIALPIALGKSWNQVPYLRFGDSVPVPTGSPWGVTDGTRTRDLRSHNPPTSVSPRC